MLSAIALFPLLASLASAAVLPRAGTEYDLSSGSQVQVKQSAAVGLSLEFFAFPGYVDLKQTNQCLKNLDKAAGASTEIRIGGTTQFFDLAGKLGRPTTIGLNRRLNNLNNTIDAAKVAVKKMKNLNAIELGNEPDLYVSSDPIAGGQSWTPALDAEIQVSWQKSVGDALGKKNIIEAGVFLQPPKFSIQELGPVEVSSGSLEYVKTWADHAYPQSACGSSTTNLESLQNHSSIVKFVAGFQSEVDAARSLGDRPLYFGETNSATCGGGGISPTFGAALWLADYVLQSVKLGYERLYFHQGTIGNSPYSWWAQSKVFAPYYGAHFAASALEGASSLSQIDDGTSHLAIYAVHSHNKVSRAIIINTSYYPNSTVARSSEDVVLSGFSKSCKSAQAKRLTAQDSYSQQELGENPTFGGQSFANETCVAQGKERLEKVAVKNGKATVSVGASEAVLVYFE
ncbi:hypothetical protein IAT38_007287 [Cryptococcus sp. DSM 104549]